VSARRAAPLPRRIFLDSSGYLALVNPRDAYHQQAAAGATLVGRELWRPYTSNYVIAEAHALFLARLGRHHAATFLDQFEASATTILWIQPPEATRAQAIIRQYADKNCSLTEATSFVLMERYRIGVALTSDRNFAQYGFVTLGGEP
jgi:uncharacterized protein